MEAPVQPSVPIPAPTPIKVDARVYRLPFSQSRIHCSSYYEDLNIYAGTNLELLFDYLNEGTSAAYGKLVRGPPGCGKSAAVWMYSMGYVDKFPHAVLCWINAQTERRHILHNKKFYEDRPTGMDYIKFENKYVNALVVDGITNTNAQKWIEVIRGAENQGKWVVLVTSQVLPREFQTVIEHKVSAWTLMEYQEACSHDAFFQQVVTKLGGEAGQDYSPEQRAALVEEKYKIAGRSCRWMFDTDSAD
jgi:hypothetical protein